MSVQSRVNLINSYPDMLAAWKGRATEPRYVFINGEEFECLDDAGAVDLLVSHSGCAPSRAETLINRRCQGTVNGTKVRILRATYARANVVASGKVVLTAGREALEWSYRTAEGQALRALANRI